MKNIFIILIVIITLIVPIRSIHALEDKDIRWYEGSTYRVTPTDNMVTEINYTIKVIDFPSPVRGVRTINGTVPDRPVVPFVTIELYKDIVNNPNPIDKFSLGVGNEYITPDKELKIVLDSMSGEMSQDWVYEYYNPSATIRIQKRALPNLDINIALKNTMEEDLEEDKIRPGDRFIIQIKIRNTGEDTLKNIEFNVIDPSLLIIPEGLKYSIYRLDKGEEKIEKINVAAPIFLEEEEYGIYVDAIGYDVKDVFYNWNASKAIRVRGDLGLIRVNKTVPRSSIYLKENAFVVINIINGGHLSMDSVTIYDFIPDDLLFIDKNINLSKNINNETEFSFYKNSIGPSDSWTFYYNLIPSEPGIYILPRFRVTYSIVGRNFEFFSEEAGFRVFGPVVVLAKSAIKKDEVDTVEVTVSAKNIGNGFTRIVIEDKLPESATLISGTLNMTTYLDPNTEKSMNYIVKIPFIDNNIDSNINTNIVNVTSWPPARATYYLDDYKFNTSSDQKIEDIQEHRVSTIYKENKENKENKEEKEKTGVISEISEVEVTMTLPEMDENQKRVVATIPIKTPVKTPEKSIPGFMFYESSIVILLGILLGIFLGKRLKR